VDWPRLAEQISRQIRQTTIQPPRRHRLIRLWAPVAAAAAAVLAFVLFWAGSSVPQSEPVVRIAYYDAGCTQSDAAVIEQVCYHRVDASAQSADRRVAVRLAPMGGSSDGAQSVRVRFDRVDHDASAEQTTVRVRVGPGA
jgi:hypothetical protein